jgi:hypothetical protein
MTGGLSFAAGANGTATMTVQGKLSDLNQALEGLTYIPTSGFSGVDILSISFSGKGTPSPCKGSVAITVNQAWPDYYFVDVQLATPYGTTSHLLVPAWHLGKTGTGTLPTVGTDPGTAAPAPGGNGSVGSSQPQWNTASVSVSYVTKGSGIALSDPPGYTPSALTLNLGPNYQVPSDGNLLLKTTLSAKTSSTVPTVTIAVKPATSGTTAGNYDATAHVLTITGADLNNLATNVFAVLGAQFGASNPISPTNNTLTLGTTISGTGQSDVKVANSLAVKLVAAAPQPGLTSASSSATGAGRGTATK